MILESEFVFKCQPMTNLPDLEQFRPYLNLMARISLGRKLQAKVAPSDVVQETLLEAHGNLDRFRGGGVAQQVAWLRKLLASNLAKVGRRSPQAEAGRRAREIAGSDDAALLGAAHDVSGRGRIVPQ